MTVTLGTIANHPPLLALRERMIDDLLDAALLGFGIALGVVVIALAGLHYAGGRLKRGRHLRGGELVSARQLRRRGRALAPPAPAAVRTIFRPALPHRRHPPQVPRRMADRPHQAAIPEPPQVAERFVPWAEEKAGTGQVDMPEDDGVERPGEGKDAIERAPRARPQSTCGNPNRLRRIRKSCGRTRTRNGWKADAEPLEATQPGLSFAEDADTDGRVVGGAARTEVDLDAGPDEDSKPPGATANRTDTQGRQSPDGAKPEGGMIRI